MVIVLVWFLASVLASLVIGRGIRLADHMEGTSE